MNKSRFIFLLLKQSLEVDELYFSESKFKIKIQELRVVSEFNVMSIFIQNLI